MPLRLDNAKCVAHMPTAEQQQTKKDFKPQFKVDHAASPMPETRLPERLAPGRHQIGMVGEIISESWARSNRYTRARSSKSAIEDRTSPERLRLPWARCHHSVGQSMSRLYRTHSARPEMPVRTASKQSSEETVWVIRPRLSGNLRLSDIRRRRAARWKSQRQRNVATLQIARSANVCFGGCMPAQRSSASERQLEPRLSVGTAVCTTIHRSA